MASGNGSRVLILALSKITADVAAVQPRMGMDMDHVKYLATMAREHEAKFTLQVVFDGKTYWLFDGFHRHEALRSLHHMGAEYRQVRCEVFDGTKGDAVAMAAQANAKTLLPLTPEDRKKCMWNLLDLGEEWPGKSPSSIGKAVGLAHATARRFWLEYFAARGLPVPDLVEASNGTIRPSSQRKRGSSEPLRVSAGDRNGRFYSNFEGKRIEMQAKSAPEASAKMREIVERSESTKRSYETSSETVSVLTGFRVHSETVLGTKASSFPGLFGRKTGDAAFTWDSFRDKADVVAASGRALWLREHAGLARAVVLCPVEDGTAEVFDVFRRIGVEFMTIEDFVASLRAEGERTPKE